MVEQLQILVKLQIVDKTIYDLTQEQSVIPGRLEELGARKETTEAELNRLKSELDQISSRRKAMEDETETVKTRLRRAENRLMQSKSQKEYRAANAEIEEGKDALKGNEDATLELMEQQESLVKEVEKAEAAAAEAKQEAEANEQELRSRFDHLEKEVQRLSGKRDDYVGKVDVDLMGQYDFIRKKRQGVAMAPVSNGTCMVCHIQIPPQQFNELQRLDRLMTCPSCSRLLYWADAEQFTNL